MLSVVAPSSQSPDVGMQPEVTAETKRVTGAHGGVGEGNNRERGRGIQGAVT